MNRFLKQSPGNDDNGQRKRWFSFGDVLDSGGTFDLLNIVAKEQRPKDFEHKATYNVL